MKKRMYNQKFYSISFQKSLVATYLTLLALAEEESILKTAKMRLSDVN